jgi:hypothetical protein
LTGTSAAWKPHPPLCWREMLLGKVWHAAPLSKKQVRLDPPKQIFFLLIAEIVLLALQAPASLGNLAHRFNQEWTCSARCGMLHFRPKKRCALIPPQKKFFLRSLKSFLLVLQANSPLKNSPIASMDSGRAQQGAACRTFVQKTGAP